jgi:geranylgeranyl diphosphate synthase type I
MYNLKEFKLIFDPVLNEFVDKKLKDFYEKTKDEFIRDFVSYSENLISSGGKRIRPYLAYLMYEAMGGQSTNEAIRVFVSLELFHNFCLMHDDIMDKSSERHGVETIHTYVTKKLSQEKRLGDLTHIGQSQAILTGDLLFSWSIESFNANGSFPKENVKKAQEYFYKMIDDVILGQMIDMDLTTREKSSEELVEEKIVMKTSYYTFVRPLQIGAYLADSNCNMEMFAVELGTKLGMAFQMQDDLLDIVGDPKIMNKNILRDIQERQHTFFTNYIFTKGSEKQRQELKKYFGEKVNENSQKEIVKLFENSGAIDQGKKIISENLSEARKIVENSDFDKKYKEYLQNLITLIEQRQS